MVSGNPLLLVEEPEEPGALFRLSGMFCDTNGNVMLEIRKNQWLVSAGNWDSEFTGGRIIVSQSKGDQCLIIRALPPDGIAVEKIDLVFKGGLRFRGDSDGVEIIGKYGMTKLTGKAVHYGQIGIAM
jgi:hypothetical protein